MYKPTLEQVEGMADKGNLIPIHRDLPADMETPVSIYLKLQDEGSSFLLESVSGGEQVARYSFIGVRPRGLLTTFGNEVYLARKDTGSHSLEKGLDRWECSNKKCPGISRCAWPICRASSAARWAI
jgi:anthranilate synthase component 1